MTRSISKGLETKEIPGMGTGIEIVAESRMDPVHRNFLKSAELSGLAEAESWTVIGSNSAINYSTHGVFRYFGKFPAPIARHLISKYVSDNGLVIDPACGSGTTGVEALWLGRKAKLYDVNPLAVLVSKVKSRYISLKDLELAISNFETRYRSIRARKFETEEIDLSHWFNDETVLSLSRIKKAIAGEPNEHLLDFLSMCFASVVRKSSRATTQQGRLFLDVETSVDDVFPMFMTQARKAALKISELPKNRSVTVKQKSLLDKPTIEKSKADLVIYHPPYFNAYKYSSINSLELAWMDLQRKDIRKSEIREFFKVGKPENVDVYVNDMAVSLRNIVPYMNNESRLTVMIGDALMKGVHIPATANLLRAVADVYTVEQVALRVPRYTEASWASSQRRNKESLGVTMFDYIVTLRLL